VQDRTRRRDDAVATFLLHSRESGQELVGDVFAQPDLTECRPSDHQGLAALKRPEATLRIGGVIRKLEGRDIGVVDLAQVVVRRVISSQPASGVTMRHGEVVERSA
jgi:hypothetical protein